MLRKKRKRTKTFIFLRYSGPRRLIQERRIYPTYAVAMKRVAKFTGSASILVVDQDGKIAYRQGEELPCNVQFAALSARTWYTSVAKRIASLRLRKLWHKRMRHQRKLSRLQDQQKSTATKETSDADEGV